MIVKQFCAIYWWQQIVMYHLLMISNSVMWYIYIYTDDTNKNVLPTANSQMQ